MDWLPLTLLSVAAFATTNLDDAFVLLLFFGDRRYRARHVFIGQALGVGLLVLLSLIGALVALALPARAIGLLGLLPIAIGVKHLLERRRGQPDEPEAAASPPGAAGWRQAAAVAGITVANGGDNIGVYAPLFAARTTEQLSLLMAVFAAMLVVWLFGAFYLARRSAVAGPMQRISRAVFPFTLIALGLLIMAQTFMG